MSHSVLLESNIIKSHLSPKALAVYVALRSRNSKEDYIYVTPAFLYYELSHSLDMTRSDFNAIIEGLLELEENNYIKCIDSKGNSFVFNIHNLFFTNEKFTYVDSSDVRKIFSSSIKANKYILLKYYLVMINSLSGGYKVLVEDKYKPNILGDMSIEYLADLSDIEYSSALKYNTELERLKLIYIHRKIRKKNFYCKYEYKDYAIAYINNVVNKSNYSEAS